DRHRGAKERPRWFLISPLRLLVTCAISIYDHPVQGERGAEPALPEVSGQCEHRWIRRSMRHIALFFAAAALFTAGSGGAQSVEEFYAGKQITFIVGASAGGATTDKHVWWRAILVNISRGLRQSSCRTCRERAASRRPITSIMLRPRTAPSSLS